MASDGCNPWRCSRREGLNGALQPLPCCRKTRPICACAVAGVCCAGGRRGHRLLQPVRDSSIAHEWTPAVSQLMHCTICSLAAVNCQTSLPYMAQRAEGTAATSWLPAGRHALREVAAGRSPHSSRRVQLTGLFDARVHVRARFLAVRPARGLVVTGSGLPESARALVTQWLADSACHKASASRVADRFLP